MSNLQRLTALFGRLRQSPPLLRGRCHATSTASAANGGSLPSQAEAVVVGGGVVGASTAYHLAKRGVRVLLLERHKLTSGTTWHSAAMINTPRGDIHDGELVKYTKQLITDVLESETGVSPGYVGNGGLTITRNQERLMEFRRMAALSDLLKTGHVMVTREEIEKIHPLLDLTGVLGGLYCESDGSVDPSSLTNAYVRGAKNQGAQIIEECPVEDILCKNGRVEGVVTKKGKIHCDTVILATGAWTRQLGQKVDISIPLKVNKHSYVVSGIVPELKDGRSLPNVRLYDDSIYFTVKNETIFLGAFEANPDFIEPDPDQAFPLYDLNWDVYAPYLEKFISVFPSLERVGHRTTICGPESFTPDGKPLFGETDIRGLYLNSAMNSRGIQASGGLGRELASLVVDGATSVDMFSNDIARFQDAVVDNQRWLDEAVHEGEVQTYWVGFPTLQRFGGRDLRQSPLHTACSQRGAFFGTNGGYEVPRFYLPELRDRLAVGKYDWYGFYGHEKAAKTLYEEVHEEYADWTYSPRISDAIGREVRACRNDVALLDLSSFGKIRVSGPSAPALLEKVCTANIQGLRIGSSAYTLMLNHSGGIEADFVIARESKDSFYLTVGAGTPKYVRRWLKKHSEKLSEPVAAMIIEVTDDLCIIGLQGPNSADLVKAILDDPKAILPEYSRFCPAEIDGARVDIHRLSYVGELGYELHFEAGLCQKVLDTILRAKPDVTFCGSEAMNSMSMEAGYRHWHGDIESTDTPQEAGMGFLCKKEQDFVGKAEVKAQKIYGINKRLVCFTVDKNVALNGMETIYRNGELCGYINRASFAYTFDKSIGMGYITNSTEPVTKDYVTDASYELDVMGDRTRAEVHLKSLYAKKR